MASVFRVNRNREMNGNLIMYWGLQVGCSVFRSADPPSTVPEHGKIIEIIGFCVNF